MKIQKMRASFGALRGEELSFGGGLNVVAAGNESGKSTWCAFIRAMLYGVDSAEREKAGAPKPDKLKYAPWSGAPMEGSMDLLWGGRAVTISRRTKLPSAPMREFSAVYAGTGETVPGLDGKNAGELLTGVPRGVFERSAYIRQSGLRVSGSPELSARIAAIVSTGEEDASYAEADERLRRWVRNRRFNRRGRLPELEEEMRGVEARLRELEAAAGEKDGLEREIKEAEATRAALFAQVEESRKRQRRETLSAMSRGAQELRELEAAREAAWETERARREETQRGVFSGMDASEAAEKAAADKGEALRLSSAGALKPSPALWLIPLAVTLLGAALGYVLSPWLYVLAVLGGAGAVFMLLRCRRRREAAFSAVRRRLDLLAEYGAADEPGMDAALAAHLDALSRWEAAAGDLECAELAVAESKEVRDGLGTRVLTELDFSGGDTEAARLSRRLGLADEELRRLREARAKAEGRLRTLGDPAALGDRLGALGAEYRRVEKQLEALELAVSVLGEANTEIQTRFSPRLGRRASELMERLTGGRYAGLAMDKDMRAETRLSGDAVARDAGFLSEGAENQLYLALRLAIVELALPGEDPCPLVLDDALVSFDDTRMGLALDLLRELAKDRQILLFSCQSREADYLAGAEDVRVIRL